MKQHAIKLSIEYGRSLMHAVTGISDGSERAISEWQYWTSPLGMATDVTPLPMQTIWSMASNGREAPDPKYVPIQPLTLTSVDDGWVLNPRNDEDDLATAAQTLGKSFHANDNANETNFDRFYFLMQKYASTLPCTYGEEGVSLFRQWCMVTAMIAITNGETTDEIPSLALIGVDLPGIQEMVYTITSRGAGKGVRGRSAFVQLLISAVVDRLLDKLELCRANVIVNGGGNAIILCNGADGLAEKLYEIESAINRVLFNGGSLRTLAEKEERFAGFKGDLALALACEPLPLDAISHAMTSAGTESAWQKAERQLKERMAIAKQQPFAVLLDELTASPIAPTNESLFETFFTPDTAASDAFCAVCRRPQEEGEEFDSDSDLEPTALEPNIARCPECQGFEQLARAMAKETKYLVRRVDKPAKIAGWQRVLNSVSGYWYSIEKEIAENGLTLTFEVDAFPAEGVDGFTFLATTTPTETDGKIRDNGELADDVPSSLKRLGVLKADVDDLAKLLVEALPKRSAAQTAMFSDSLALFFGGWLNQLCRTMGTKANSEHNTRIYVLYAGGDDLLIIGSWDLMPMLAQRIAMDFAEFTGQNPSVHLSAGLVLVGGKEPLYAAVESADRELDIAKQKGERRGKVEKNAISFLGKRHSWQDFKEVVKWQKKLVNLRNQGAPSSLLTALLTIHTQYKRDRGEIYGIPERGKVGVYNKTQEQLYMGPWLWKMLYRLARFAHVKEYKSTIADLQQALLQQGGIERISVSARWAQFLTRKDAEHNA